MKLYVPITICGHAEIEMESRRKAVVAVEINYDDVGKVVAVNRKRDVFSEDFTMLEHDDPRAAIAFDYVDRAEFWPRGFTTRHIRS